MLLCSYKLQALKGSWEREERFLLKCSSIEVLREKDTYVSLYLVSAFKLEFKQNILYRGHTIDRESCKMDLLSRALDSFLCLFMLCSCCIPLHHLGIMTLRPQVLHYRLV